MVEQQWRSAGSTRRRQRWRPTRQRRTAGLLLPLSGLMSLLLLLGSLSVQTVSLQSRLQGDSEQQLQISEDRLNSAAQLLVARIQQQHACLLLLGLERWSDAACASPSEQALLRQGEVFGSAWQLVRWQPDTTIQSEGGVQRLTLELALAAQAGALARRSGFELRLAGQPSQVQELRPLGLRSERP